MKVYALKNTKEYKSASGGAFPAIVDSITKLFPNENVSIYGAIFDNNFNVTHSRIVLPESIDGFKGSKYVYSSVSGIFQKVLSDLKSDYIVIFSGTPCQCDALKKYLYKANISSKRIILVDIICHGTAIPSYWKAFVQWLQKKYNAEMVDFSFRFQNAKWKRYPVKAEFITHNKKHKVIINTHVLRSYTRLFFSNMIMREICYTCKYANVNRVTDLSIGDFWGIKKVLPAFQYHKNVSQVLVSSDMGQKIINTIKKNSDVILMECKNNEYLKYQHNLNMPTERPLDTDNLRVEFEDNGIEYILKKYADLNMKGLVKHIIQRILRY